MMCVFYVLQYAKRHISRHRRVKKLSLPLLSHTCLRHQSVKQGADPGFGKGSAPLR